MCGQGQPPGFLFVLVGIRSHAAGSRDQCADDFMIIKMAEFLY